MGALAIQVRDLGKCYRIGAKRTGVLLHEGFQQSLARWGRRAGHVFGLAQAPPEEETLWALRRVSFEVPHGGVVGLIGRNGSGKSTLLKILSRLTTPTEGEVEIEGRVSSLLEVGVGFQPELTGRENIYLSGTIIGMRQTEISAKFDQIVSFAEVERFIDTPIKHYSSGMAMRLAFAVSAHLDAEIMLLDEVLAVGDLAFQHRCFQKMDEVRRQGRTILLVSHSMQPIAGLCSKALWLDQGAIAAWGDGRSVAEQYTKSGGSAPAPAPAPA